MVHHQALTNRITVDAQFKNTALLIYENFIGKCYQIKDQLLIVIIYLTYRFIYPVSLNYEIMDLKFNIFAYIPLMYIFIIRRFAGNKFFNKKCEDKLIKLL